MRVGRCAVWAACVRPAHFIVAVGWGDELLGVQAALGLCLAPVNLVAWAAQHALLCWGWREARRVVIKTLS